MTDTATTRYTFAYFYALDTDDMTFLSSYFGNDFYLNQSDEQDLFADDGDQMVEFHPAHEDTIPVPIKTWTRAVGKTDDAMVEKFGFLSNARYCRIPTKMDRGVPVQWTHCLAAVTEDGRVLMASPIKLCEMLCKDRLRAEATADVVYDPIIDGSLPSHRNVQVNFDVVSNWVEE